MKRFLRIRWVIILLLVTLSCTSSKETVKEDTVSIEQESLLNSFIYDHRENLKKETAVKTVGQNMLFGDDVDADSLLERMTLREKIGQLFFVSANGYFLNDDAEIWENLKQKVVEQHVGGIIFSTGTVYGQAVLTNKLQKLSNIPLWITQDMEYGAAMRVRRTTRLTPAMGITATGNPEYAYWSGKITAREAKALGVHQIFAPVLDVNNNPDNPIINVRSFSGDPNLVAEFGKAFIAGVQSEGIVATAKHFPGHGDTDVDSHLSLPVISSDYTRLDTLELIPFKAAIKDGVSSIMSAHIAFPALGSDGGTLPGTLDQKILGGILQDSLDFNGIVITDGLEMSGISDSFSPGEAVVKALQAGADLMLLSPDEFTAINEIEKKVIQGVITEKRIDHSVRKLLQWKIDHGLFQKSSVDVDQLSRQINIRNHRLLADEIARESITVVKNDQGILPIRAADNPRVLVISVADDESGTTGTYFANEIKKYHPDVHFHVFDKRSSREEKQEILQDARRADLLILGSFIFVRSHKPIQLSSEQESFLKRLISVPKKSVLVAFGNPYIFRDLPDTDVHVMAWASNSDQIRNTVPALFGASEVSGKMPIQIPGMYNIGDGHEIPQTTIRYDEPGTVGFYADSLKKIDRLMENAIYDSTFPGGTVTILKDGVIAYQKAFGYHTYDKLKRVQTSDVYDLASLTKIVATTTAVMDLVDNNKLSLDDKVSNFFPEFGDGQKRKITIRNLLVHDSGLPPFRVYIDSIKNPEKIIDAVKNEPLTYAPGSKTVYSDLGFILLAEIVKQISGDRLDTYLRKKFYYPLGMSSTFFNPGELGLWMKKRIPPSEIDTVYRNKLIHAEVNDERAFYLNGVAGHAGLFSSGYDLAIYAQMLLNGGSYGGRKYISAETVKIFNSYRSETGNRALGFDRKSDGFSSAGTLTGKDTYGHLGFTGTSLWIDPSRDLSVIILTNRTYPYRSYGKNIGKIRASVADAVVSSIRNEQ